MLPDSLIKIVFLNESEISNFDSNINLFYCIIDSYRIGYISDI